MRVIFSAGAADDEPPVVLPVSLDEHAVVIPSAAVITDATASILPRRMLFFIPDPSQVVARSLGGGIEGRPRQSGPAMCWIPQS